MVRRHGKIEGKVNILGLGRLGTRQMTVQALTLICWSFMKHRDQLIK